MCYRNRDRRRHDQRSRLPAKPTQSRIRAPSLCLLLHGRSVINPNTIPISLGGVQRSSKLLSAARQASAAMTGVRLNDGELSAKLGPRSCSGPPGCLRRLSASHPCHHGRLLPTVWTAQAYPRAGRQLASSPAQARWLGRRVRGDAHRWPRSSTGMRELVGDLPRQQASLGEGGGDGLAGAVPYGRLTCRRAEGRRNLLVRWLPLTDWPVPLRKGRGCWGPALGVVVSLRVEAPSPIPPW